MKRKMFLPFIILSLLTFGMIGCNSNQNTSQSSSQDETKSLISLSDNSISITEEKTYQLSVAVDESLKNNIVFWTSRDSEIATVSSNGLVTAVKEGSTFISVQVGEYIARCSVNVLPYEPDAYLNVHLENDNFNLNVNDEYKLELEVTYGYEIIEDYSLSGDVGDSAIADFNDGIIVAKQKGKTDIILTITYNSVSINELIYVNVY